MKRQTKEKGLPTARGRSALIGGALLFAVAAGFPGECAAADSSRRLRQTHVSSIDLRQARVDDALDVLRDAAQTADSDGVGVNIVYRGPPPEELPRISLRLRNVSLWDALRYLTELSGLRVRVDERAVVVMAADAPAGKIETRLYPVQPSVYQDMIRDFNVEREESRPSFFSR